MLDSLSENKKQLTKFVMIGMLAVLTDLVFYTAFLQVIQTDLFGGWVNNEAVCKALSFLCGLCVTYYLNKRWTWRKKDKSNKRLVKFLFAYGVSLVLNVTINSLILKMLHSQAIFASVPRKYFIAFMGATVFCSAFNFLGQKFWIFRNKKPVVA